jgi:hypothetical protein
VFHSKKGIKENDDVIVCVTRAKETGGQCVDGRTCGVSCEKIAKNHSTSVCVSDSGIAHALVMVKFFSPSTTENERKKRGALARPLPSVPVCFFSRLPIDDDARNNLENYRENPSLKQNKNFDF